MTDNNNNSNNNTTNTPTEQERRRTLPNILHGLFPFSFVIRQNTNNNNNVQNSGQGRTANEQTNDNSNNGGNNNNNNIEQEIRFFMMPFPPTGNDDSIPIIFFTPVFMAPPESRKPRASEKTMKELPIVKITKEHVESSASCSICLEHFRMSKTDDDDVNNVENMITNDEKFDTSNNKNAENEKSNVVRKMPCEHMFCETCLFEWLRQNNTCPLCRYELPAEGQEQESNNNNVNNNDVNMANSNSNDDEPSVGSTTNIRSSYNTDEESSASTSTTTTSPLPSPLNQHNHQNVGCAFAELGMCEVANNAQNRNNDNNDNNGDDVVGSLSSMIITLPQCRHRFHASCLRTTLLISGYSLESNTLDLRCPICRVRSILRENLLKVLNNHSFPPTSTTTTTSLPQQNGQITTTTTSSSSLHITAPYVIHFNDEMDLD